MKLFNPLSQNIEPFIPFNQKKVTMYVCGITPYDTTHLGHAFTYTIFDALWRYLEYSGYEVIYTQNVTDIDDDILKRARRDHVNWRNLGNDWTQRYIQDMQWLNNRKPTYYILATDTIEKIVEMVKGLEEKGFAYEREGTVYFEVAKFPSYGQLSHLETQQMISLSRERGADPDDPNKKNPLDFILWQKSLDEEPFWNSPWGQGRPGWHIECSAIINKFLGDQIDIHGGGKDLEYPHHESEIAQSETFTGKIPFVKNWMHTGMVEYQGEKMSKSLGNLILVSSLSEKFSANALRFYLLSHHYRQVWEYSESDLKEAERFVSGLPHPLIHTPLSSSDEEVEKLLQKVLDNDFDTSSVMKNIAALLEQNPNNAAALNFLIMLGLQ